MKTFGNGFELPRTIPFMNQEHIHAYLIGDYFLISSSKDSFGIPVFFTNVSVVNEDEYDFITPIGSFRLSFTENDVMNFYMKYSMYSLLTSKQEFGYGESKITNLAKNSIFECLVVYQLRGDTKIQFHTMAVKASNEGECYDSCYAKVNESLQDPPVFFNVKVINIEDAPKAFTFI